MEPNSPSLVEILRIGMVIIFMLSFTLSLLSILLGIVRFETVQGVIVIFPFIITITGLFELVSWISLLFILILFFFWTGQKSFQKSKEQIVPVARQCPKCASFLPLNVGYCFTCGEEVPSSLSPTKH